MSNEPGTNSDLCWYNTLSGDFSSEKGLHKPNASRKRQPFGLEDVHKDDVSATTADSTSTDVEGYLSATSVPNKLLGSPTKRRRPSTKGNSHTQTPTKPRNIAGNADNTSPIGTGIQTPPPSSTGTTRKHGRSSKCVSSASTSSTDLISPPQTSPTKASAIGVPRTRVPVNRPARRLDRIGRSVPSRPASPIHDNAVERALPHTNLDWSLLRGEISTLSAPLNTSCDESSPSTEDLVDSVAFSFTQSSDFECLPRGVDPNLIFYSSTESVSSSMTDGCNNAVSSFLGIPYHHQYMHQQREEQRRLRKRQGSSSYKGPETHAAKDGLARRCADRSTLPGYSSSSAPVPMYKSHLLSGARSKGALSQSQSTNSQYPSIRPSSRQSRNEVVLNISPRGRAKAEKTVVLESDTEIEDGLVNTTSDSFDESDSSFDDDIPRGLGPDGSEYISFRRRRAAQKHRSNPGAEIESRENTCPNNTLPTPTRRVAAFAMSAAAAATRTGYESSPRLPTPMRSSPPATLSRSSASFINKKLSLKDMQILYNYATNSDDESEAETVVDESVDFPGDADDGDAVTALRRVMGAGRPRCSVGGTQV